MVSKHWSPLQKALIGEVKRYYPPVYGKALHKPTANPICNWKAIAVNLGSTTDRCRTEWSRIKNKYVKLYILIQSGRLKEHDNKSLYPCFIQKYLDGSLKFLDNYYSNVKDCHLPESVNKWGDSILDKIKQRNVASSQRKLKKSKLITHDQVKEILLSRDLKTELNIEDEDIHNLQKTIQNLINYKLSEVINGNPSALNDKLGENKKMTNSGTVVTIDSDSDENIEDTTENIHHEFTTIDELTEKNVEDVTTNKSIEVESTINKGNVWEGTIQNLINYKLCKVISDNSNSHDVSKNDINITNSHGTDITINSKSEENNKVMTENVSAIKNYADRKTNSILAKIVLNEVMLKDNTMEENIKDTQTYESMGLSDDDYEDNIPLHKLKNLKNLHSEVILKDDIKEEPIKDATDVTMEVESEKRKEKTINLHSEIVLPDDIKEEMIEEKTQATMNVSMEVESTINKDDVLEKNRILENKKKAKKLLHSLIVLNDGLKEENIIVNSINERMEDESTIDDSCKEYMVSETSNLFNNVMENTEELNDEKVKKFFEDLGDTMSLFLSSEKQEELKSRINEVIKLRFFINRMK